MTAEARIERLRLTNPAAAELAVACALAARVEPSLLRRLRLLIPHADAAAEADLWFSDLLAGRDVTAISLDPLVADVLRQELRRPSLSGLLAAAHKEITSAHAKAHWSVRLEERVHYLDVAQPPTADQEVDDLLLAALNQLRVEPNPRGVARWLAGAVGRLPRQVSASLTGRASAAAAMLHLDQQAPAAELLDAGESQAWLPWLADALPKVAVPVQLLDGAVVLGADGPNSVMLPDVPDTEPLVVEVRWTSGNRAMSHRARFRVEDPVQVETGSSAVTLVTLTGASFDLAADDRAVASAGLNFDHLKATLRPCLGREEELAQLRPSHEGSSWVNIDGRARSGRSTLLVATADEARAAGMAVIEHFLTAEPDHMLIHRSFLAQLQAEYPAEFSRLPPAMTDPKATFAMALDELAELNAFRRRPLMIAIDGLDLDERGDPALVPNSLHENVHYRTTSASRLGTTAEELVRFVELTGYSDRRVCMSMIERDRAKIDQAFAANLGDGGELAALANDLPGKLTPILRWITSQPPATVTMDTIPPVLTTRWTAIQDYLDSKFGRPNSIILLDLLRAAHGKHTWNDCAELRVGINDLTIVNMWRDFWRECVNARLVLDAEPDELVEVVEPAALEQALRPYSAGRDDYFGLSGQISADLVSRTRLAAAVGHALAFDKIADALRLCRDLSVLRRRYAEDTAGLLTDLDQMTPHHPDMATLRTVVQGLAKEGVSPADFVPALHTRLAERDSVNIVNGWRVLPPLRVSHVTNEPDLQAATSTDTAPSPALAIAQMINTPISVPGDPNGIVLVGVSNLSTMDGQVLISGWGNAAGAARGLDGGYALWTESAVWTDTMFDSIPYDGPIDHAVRLPSAVAIAATDGSVTLLATPGGQSRQLAGHGARVTAIIEFEGNVFAAAEDGTIRNVPALGEQPLTYAGHRGAVRCLAGQKPAGFVSGGDDGFLLKWVSGVLHPLARWQASAPITCLVTVGDTVIFGTADGQIQTWNPNTGSSITLGSHDAPVRGVTAEGTIVVSWADSVRFHARLRPQLLTSATGFPGGVRDVILGKDTYTVLCGDGSVQRRRRPTGRRMDDRARACLEIAEGQIYAGLGRTLLRIAPDGTTTTVSNKGPFLQATKTGAGIAARQQDAVAFFAPSGGTADMNAAIDLAAGNRAGTFVDATDRSISTWTVDVKPNGVSMSWDRSRPVEHITRNTITSLAVASDGVVIAGQINGDTLLGSEGRDTVIPGDSRPITVVAEVPNGVMTASASGSITYWPREGGPATFQRRRVTTTMATSGEWLITAGEDGYVVLWATTPPRPVHEINLGAPIVALAAEDELVAARDAYGRLWRFVLHLPTDELPARNLTVGGGPSSRGQFTLELDDQSDDDYELTAIRVSIDDDQPLDLVVPTHWPRLEPNGRLTVPLRPHPSQPLQIICSPVHLVGRPLSQLKVSVDIASPTVSGYRTTQTLFV